MLPCIFPLTIEDDVFAKAFCNIIIIIIPGAKKCEKGIPNISGLALPIATEKTKRKVMRSLMVQIRFVAKLLGNALFLSVFGYKGPTN